MGDNWDEKDYIKYYRRNYDLLHGFKIRWYQKLWVKFLCWWYLDRKIKWR